ncbi:MAG: hypothetical protein HGJ93_15790 [Desulfosarcina sp.]|nr:hypothetical protein [Desulfosarcina sp.]MBC2767361.1 hypothetical protein [Desulfosarcina sp.]
MGLDKKALIKALNVSVKDLQQGIDMHCCLVASILEEKVDERNLKKRTCGCRQNLSGSGSRTAVSERKPKKSSGKLLR